MRSRCRKTRGVLVWRWLQQLREVQPSRSSTSDQAHLETRRYQLLRIAEMFTRADGEALLYIGRDSIMPGQSAWPMPHDAPYKPVIDRCLMAVIEVS
ncbi:hypothetical protein Pmani_014186 [Petrolisthes manimaculis]|uniref:Uncharacterized protein n=1 Tax=Petrolisthes manimaculis TaxID=1843537 RepID=A0AAE1UB82_9EUCA|nr:hypothetical protein Pmani_014186 [Petrolisthes manimaculis]